MTLIDKYTGWINQDIDSWDLNSKLVRLPNSWIKQVINEWLERHFLNKPHGTVNYMRCIEYWRDQIEQAWDEVIS